MKIKMKVNVVYDGLRLVAGQIYDLPQKKLRGLGKSAYVKVRRGKAQVPTSTTPKGYEAPENKALGKGKTKVK